MPLATMYVDDLEETLTLNDVTLPRNGRQLDMNFMKNESLGKEGSGRQASSELYIEKCSVSVIGLLGDGTKNLPPSGFIHMLCVKLSETLLVTTRNSLTSLDDWLEISYRTGGIPAMTKPLVN
ncbi:hypothetical protein Tco_1216197 [Tanacetum coccineum]